ncbi:MAG: hypothetical protein OQK82_01295 [Candidatus Pacearchaeota archaeon]|nr:hypothetical protein [Candidatus Pacearchaeota archaeon]
MVLDFNEYGDCITPEGEKGTVELYNVVTKGSLDTGLWNVLETKDKSIKQIMQNRDKSTREIEEDYYGSVKELSIDNPLMKEAVELQHDLKKLHSMQNAYNSMVASARRSIQSLPGTIERKIRKKESIEEDLAVRSPYLKGDAFFIEIRGETIKKRKEAGEMIIAIAESLRRQVKEKNHREVMKEKIGRYAGFEIGIEAGNQFGEIVPRLVAYGKYQYSTEFKKDPDPVGLINSFNYALYHQLDEMHASVSKEIATCQKNLEEYHVLVDKKFEHGEEIVKKELRQSEVIELLAKENEKQKEASVSFPWNTLSQMSFKEIREACEEFSRATSISVSPHEREITIATIEDIRKDISEQFSVILPSSILVKIQETSIAGNMKLDQAHLMICETIRSHEKAGYLWELDVPQAGVYARYGLSDGKMNNSIVVRRVEDSGKESFEAYRIQSGREKYLGAENSFDAMKKRVEQYVVCLLVRDKVNDINLEKKSKTSHTVHDKRESYGMEL